MVGLPFRSWSPNTIQSPPVLRVMLADVATIQDDQIDPLQGSETDTYGMEDGQSPKSPTDNVPAANAGTVRTEAMFAAQKVAEAASGQIRGFFIGQSQNAALSPSPSCKTRGDTPWGSMAYTNLMQTEQLDVVITAAAAAQEITRLRDFYRGRDLFTHLLAVQFDDGKA